MLAPRTRGPSDEDLDNVSDRLGDDLKREITPGSKVRIAASTFFIFAFRGAPQEARSGLSSILGIWSAVRASGGFGAGSVKHIYFVAETKGSLSSLELRDAEKAKIECARKFFKKLNVESENPGIKYDVVTNYSKLMQLVTA